jgi:hypothetical protein
MLISDQEKTAIAAADTNQPCISIPRRLPYLCRHLITRRQSYFATGAFLLRSTGKISG